MAGLNFGELLFFYSTLQIGGVSLTYAFFLAKYCYFLASLASVIEWEYGQLAEYFSKNLHSSYLKSYGQISDFVALRIFLI